MIGGSIALSLSKSGHDVLVLDLPQNEKAIVKQIPFVKCMKSVSELCSEKPDVIFICVPSEKVTGNSSRSFLVLHSRER